MKILRRVRFGSQGGGNWKLVVGCEAYFEGLRWLVVAKRRRGGRDIDMMSSPGALVWLGWRCLGFNFLDGRHTRGVAGVLDEVNGRGEGFLNWADVC